MSDDVSNTDRLIPFGPYFLAGRLAAGGMGEIFLAKQKGAAGFEKHVVIKKILPHLCRDKEFVTRLIDEGRLLVQLNHGNIVPVIDLGVVEGEYYLAMEYVHGADLRGLLRRAAQAQERLPVGLTVFVLAEVAKGLAYAHNRTDERGEPLGIIHRDVSPSNIMISRDGAVKILDFGIAKARDRLSHSVTGSLHGKFLYMSPEQARGDPLDGRSDLFSLGVIGYEMATGIRPFDADTDMQVLERVKHHTPAAPREANPDIAPALEAVLLRCLEKDRERRFATADELVRALNAYLYSTDQPVGEADLARWAQRFIGRAPVLPKPRSLDEALRREVEQQFGPTPAGTATRDPRRVTAPPDVPREPGDLSNVPRHTATATATATASRPMLAFFMVVSLAVLGVLVFNILYVLGYFDDQRAAPTLPAAVQSSAPARPAGDTAGPPGAAASEIAAPGVATAPRPTDAQAAAPLVPDGTAGPVAPGPGDAGGPTGPGPAPRAAPGDARAADETAGEAPRTRSIVVVVAPAADIEIRDAGGGVRKTCPRATRCTARIERGEALRAEFRAAGYEPLSAELTGNETRYRFELVPEQYEVQFRFLPAYAQIFVDGRRRSVARASNLVTLRVAAGEHRLEVRGRTRSEFHTFRIEPGRTGPLTLGTLVVNEDEPPAGSSGESSDDAP